MELHDRLQQARRDAGYATAADAARRFGWNVNTYTSNENGNRAFSRTKAVEYSKAFKVDLEWLLTGKEANDAASAEVINIWSRISGDPAKERQFLEFGRYLASKNGE